MSCNFTMYDDMGHEYGNLVMNQCIYLTKCLKQCKQFNDISSCTSKKDPVNYIVLLVNSGNSSLTMSLLLHPYKTSSLYAIVKLDTFYYHLQLIL